MKTTTNYGLKKPETNDFYNVDDFNYNTDLIDTTLNEKLDKTATAVNADTVDGLHGSQLMRYICHTGDENGGMYGSGIDFDFLTQLGVHQFAGNFSQVKNAPKGWYGDCNVLVIGEGTRLTQIVQSEVVLCFRRSAWEGNYMPWNYANSSVIIDHDIGVGTQVSYMDGTLIFVKGE